MKPTIRITIGIQSTDEVPSRLAKFFCWCSTTGIRSELKYVLRSGTVLTGVPLKRVSPSMFWIWSQPVRDRRQVRDRLGERWEARRQRSEELGLVHLERLLEEGEQAGQLGRHRRERDRLEESGCVGEVLLQRGEDGGLREACLLRDERDQLGHLGCGAALRVHDRIGGVDVLGDDVDACARAGDVCGRERGFAAFRTFCRRSGVGSG